MTWPAASVLAFAVWKGWWGGLLAAVCVGLADLAVVRFVATAGTVHNIVLLLLLGQPPEVRGLAADLGAAALHEREDLEHRVVDVPPPGRGLG